MDQQPKILLVDDEKRFVDSLHGILKHFGYICVTAHNGKDAISLLKQEPFELALLDVELPDMSGCDIAEFISSSCPGTTSIMLTGINTVETAVQSMKLGAYDFLSKPLNHEILIKTLDKARQHNRLKYQLLISEQRFQTLSEAAWEGVVIHEDGEIIEANQQFLEIFGYGQTDIEAGLTIDDVIIPESMLGARQMLGYDFDGKSEISGRKKDGSEIQLEAKSRSITYLNRPRQVCVIRDISERMKMEKEKFELQGKLASASKLNALGLMAGSVAHDLNNILTGIVSYPDLLLMQMSESDKYYKQIQKIQSAGKRAAAVVSDLVTIARGRNLEKSVENLNEIVLNYLNSLEHGERLVNFPNVLLQTRLQKDLHNICCSPQHLHKILLNLIGNGLEAVQEHGAINISTQNCLFKHPMKVEDVDVAETDYVKLVIADNGPGINQEDIGHIFEPFYSTKVMGKSGTGLGLSIVWNIIQEHNGWVEVKNVNPGASFEIYLPATRDQVCPIEVKVDKNQIMGKGEKILIIDDQAEQNKIVARSLKSIGYEPYAVTSGEEGIEFLKTNDVDLILLDMVMGDGLNGRETLEVIQAAKPHQRVIVVSGYAKSEEIEKTKALGVSLFLEKPITLSRLGVSIKHTLTKN